MWKRTTLSLALLATAAGLTGCGSDGQGGGGQQNAAASVTEKQDVKHARYVSAFNALVSAGGGIANDIRMYETDWNIPSRDPSSTLNPMFNPDFDAGIVKTLKEGRAASGTDQTKPLDAAADILIPGLEEKVRIERELKPYYDSRAYREDKLAKGKALDGELRTAHARILAGMKAMDQALAEYQHARGRAQAAALSEEGKEGEALLIEAMGQAQRMVSAPGENQDAAAAQQSAALAGTLDRMRAQQDSIEPERSRKQYANMIDELTKMQGLFSDYRNGDARAKDQVATYYNMAVDSLNLFERLK